MKATFALSLLTLAAGLSSFGCSLQAASEEEVAHSTEAVEGEGPFLYFRSNATGWGVDDNTRLLPVGTNVFALTFNVTEPWMVSSGDTATVTQTNQFNGWGTAQFFLAASDGITTVPGSDALTGTGNFTVDYAELGTHVVRVDVNRTAFIVIEKVP